MRGLLITLPASVKWEDYEKELKAVEDGILVMNFKVPFLPKDTEGIERVYMVHRGNIVGWMKFSGVCSKEFICTTTGRPWKGNFIQRTGRFHYIDPIPCRGFQGFRYYEYDE